GAGIVYDKNDYTADGTLADFIGAKLKAGPTDILIVYDKNDYTADGTLADFIAVKLKVPYSLTFELYGVPGDLDNCFEQFNPPSADVQQTLARFHGMYPSAVEFLIQARLGITQGVQWRRVEGDSPGADLHFVDLSTNMTERVMVLKESAVWVDLSTNMTERVMVFKEICGALPACKGFNTAGWLKAAVTLTPDAAAVARILPPNYSGKHPPNSAFYVKEGQGGDEGLGKEGEAEIGGASPSGNGVAARQGQLALAFGGGLGTALGGLTSGQSGQTSETGSGQRLGAGADVELKRLRGEAVEIQVSIARLIVT
ncbi:hypothetical protein T484DRAFT_1858074, partial [Baffinella frigidus]